MEVCTRIAVCFKYGDEISNPIFGPNTYVIEMEDEGAGPFIRIFNNEDTAKTIEFDIEEWRAVNKAVEKFYREYTKRTE